MGMGTEPLRHRGAGDQGCSGCQELVAMAPDSAVEGPSWLRPGDMPCVMGWVGPFAPGSSLGCPHGWDKRQNLEQSHLPSPGGPGGDEDPRTLGLVARLPMSPLCRGRRSRAFPAFQNPGSRGRALPLAAFLVSRGFSRRMGRAFVPALLSVFSCF